MIPIPAIDIIDGKCVRLYKGDFSKKTTYSEDPVQVAISFENMGFTHLHLVDLDGARKGEVVNIEILKSISESTELVIDFGGGVRSASDAEKVLNAGASQFTVGSLAVSDFEEVVRWKKEFGTEHIIIGADVKNRKVAVSGWTSDSELDVLTFIQTYSAEGFNTFISTDVSVDGTLRGPSLDLYREILDAHPEINLIASGGISSLYDATSLKEIGVAGAIIGKALYEKTIDPKKLIALC